MAENESTNENDEPVEEPAAAEAAEAAAPADPSEAEAPADTPEVEVPADAPEEPAPADAPEQAAAEPAGDQPEASEHLEQLSPRERRARARSQRRGPARPELSPEERAAERATARRAKAEGRRRWRARQRERRKAAGPRTAPAAPTPAGAGKPRVRQGVVVSDRASKTITVKIDSARAHRTYGKIVRTTSTLHAHDERDQANVGDTVRVVESRPLSRTKRWRLVEVLERAR